MGPTPGQILRKRGEIRGIRAEMGLVPPLAVKFSKFLHKNQLETLFHCLPPHHRPCQPFFTPDYLCQRRVLSFPSVLSDHLSLMPIFPLFSQFPSFPHPSPLLPPLLSPFFDQKLSRPPADVLLPSFCIVHGVFGRATLAYVNFAGAGSLCFPCSS